MVITDDVLWIVVNDPEVGEVRSPRSKRFLLCKQYDGKIVSPVVDTPEEGEFVRIPFNGDILCIKFKDI